MVEVIKNWAGNITYGTRAIYRPHSVEELQEVVRKEPKVKALGSRHSFNTIADTSEALVSTEHLDRIISIDPATMSVTAEGGIKYGALCQALYQEGFAIHNLASLPHISVAGACATATHGSGDRNGNLSSTVSGLEIVTADGEVVRFKRGDREFEGVVVNLGALGVVSSITLDILPAYEMTQNVYRNLALSEVLAHFDEIESAGYSVSLFTNWEAPKFNQVWIKRRCEDSDVALGETFFGAWRATTPMHPIDDISPVNCTDQMGVPGPSHERLPHFKMEFTPSSGEELQSEYLIPRQHIEDALRAVSALGSQIAPLLLISEVRTIAADDLWMSPCYRQPCVGIHFTWKQMWPEVQALLPTLEAALRPFGARPHWGKLFRMDAREVHPLFPKIGDFQELVTGLDPSGKFRNPFLENILWKNE